MPGSFFVMFIQTSPYHKSRAEFNLNRTITKYAGIALLDTEPSFNKIVHLIQNQRCRTHLNPKTCPSAAGCNKKGIIGTAVREA